MVMYLLQDKRCCRSLQLEGCSLSEEEVYKVQWMLCCRGVRIGGSSTDGNEVEKYCDSDFERWIKERNGSADSTKSVTCYELKVNGKMALNSASLIEPLRHFLTTHCSSDPPGVSIDLKEELTDDVTNKLCQLLSAVKDVKVKRLNLLLHHSYDNFKEVPPAVLKELENSQTTFGKFKGCIGPSGKESLAVLRDRSDSQSDVRISLSHAGELDILAHIRGKLSEYLFSWVIKWRALLYLCAV